MAAIDATRMLRAGLLDGVTLLLARAPEGADSTEASAAGAVHAACAGLGARVIELTAGPQGSARPFEEPELEAEVDRALSAAGTIDMVVVDAAGLYSATLAARSDTGEEAPGAPAQGEPPVHGGVAGRVALRACMDGAWNVARASANRAFLEPERPGRILFIAPAPRAGQHADAAAAGLENLARTLSIEWARHRVTAVAIAPGDATGAIELAALAAYLASPAGAYFSGCVLDLRGQAGG
jgi:NAD(P)-dependent dehydrogenase (short-subunit alcohol dehydrogenase family)